MAVEIVNEVKPYPELSGICEEIKVQYRRRVHFIKCKNRLRNCLFAHVALTLGYRSNLDKKQREKIWDEAEKLVKSVLDGTAKSDLSGMIKHTWMAVEVLENVASQYEKTMVKLASQTPVAGWVKEPEQRGFSLLSLANVIGECGDLNNYSSPSKVWRRMGCAPFTKEDETLMGGTWKGRKGNRKGLATLSSAEWEEYGYCPRRASVRYMIGANFVKQNGDGPYRRRWLEAKRKAYYKHPEWDWKPCPKCEGRANVGEVCKVCGGTGMKCARAHNHGLLLAAKLLLLNLWLQWTGTEWREWRPW